METNAFSIGKTEQYINSIIAQGKGVFMCLIDPDKQDPEKGAQLAQTMVEGGADIIMLGGSIGAQGDVLNETARLIKERVDVPLHLFPGNVSTLTQYADSIYFMSLLNSNNPYWITGAQSLGAPTIFQSKIEPIPTAYIVFEPGETVGKVAEANLLPRNKPDLAVAYALAAQYFGMRFVILESGSGAPEPVPPEIVTAVKAVSSLKVVVAGGVKTPEQARQLVEAGANCIHIGTKIEEAENPLERTKEFARAIHLE
jgi:phosphoglycerol geranylgeranyltransferase